MYQNGCLYKKRLYCCFSLTFNSGPTERRLEKPAEEHRCVWEFSPGHFLIRDFPAHYTEAALLCKSQPTGTHQKHEFLMLWIWDWMAEMNHFFLIPLYIGNKIITSEMKISPAFQNKKQKRNKNNNKKKNNHLCCGDNGSHEGFTVHTQWCQSLLMATSTNLFWTLNLLMSSHITVIANFHKECFPIWLAANVRLTCRRVPSQISCGS